MAILAKINWVIHAIIRMILGKHRVAFYRWRRARRDLTHLAQADVAFVSHAKAGRTWVRVMLSRLYQRKYHLPEKEIIERDNFHLRNTAIPVFLFSMGNYIADVRPIVGTTSPFQSKKLIFLARYPADTAVSYYFQISGRTNRDLLDIKRLPSNLSDVPIYEFMTNTTYGLPSVIDYMNKWAEALMLHRRHLLLRYEDVRARPEAELKRLGDFLEADFTASEYAEAVEFASFNKLKEKEKANYFQNSKLQARDPANSQSFKVRRGKVGGYRDYFKDDEIRWIEQLISNRLSSFYGYEKSPVPIATAAKS